MCLVDNVNDKDCDLFLYCFTHFNSNKVHTKTNTIIFIIFDIDQTDTIFIHVENFLLIKFSANRKQL